MSHEVLSLQFGSFANYVGAHFWNFQDELLGLQEQAQTAAAAAQVDCGVLYRQGETARGEPTYTPRLVLFDLSGSLGSTSRQGSLYAEPEPPVVSTWHGRGEVHRAPAVGRSVFAQQLQEEGEGGAEGERPAQAGGEAGLGGAESANPNALEAAARQLDAAGGVRYFTDYMKAHIHPRSVHQLPGVWHGVAAFDGWGDGAACTSSGEVREEMVEHVRYFAEEADSLQGIQCIVDDLSGFGQLAATLLPELREDLGAGLPVMLYAVRPSREEPAGRDPAAMRRRRLGEALSAAQLSQHASVFTVVAPPAGASALPLLNWRQDDAYHTSAICAAAVDTATMPYRLAVGGNAVGPIGRVDMTDLSQLLTAQHSTPLTALSMALPCACLPADAQRLGQQTDAREHHTRPDSSEQGPFALRYTSSLTPGVRSGPDAHRYAESVVLRGPRTDACTAMQLGTAASALDAALLQERQRCVRQRTLTAQALAVPLPYPHIFGPRISPAGDILLVAEGPACNRQPDVVSCPVLTRQAGTAALASAVSALRHQFRGVARSAQGQSILESWGFAKDELDEVEERLLELEMAYEDDE